jgi:glycosyltransferase involved in cell wall biosynthesis
MNLLFAVKTMDSRGGGAERVLAQVTSALAQRGHGVTLLTFDSPDSPDFYPIDPGVRRIWLNAGRKQARTSASDLVKRVTALRAIFRNDAPDVAIGFMHSAYVPLALAALGQSIPVVASEHIVWSYFGDRPLDRLVLHGTAHLYAATTFVSAGDEEGFPRVMVRRSTVISNPIQDLSATSADPAGGPRKILLSVGRLTHQKDQASLIDAFARLAGRYPEWRLRIVGEGELRGALESQVERLGLGARVELPGAVRDICNEYARAQLFVLPSRYESFGLATAEALAAGLPAVGFADCPGTNALIADEVNGLLVAGDDRVGVLAEALERLMASPNERSRFGSAGPASVEQFALPPIVSAWEALLRDLSRTRKAAC